MPTADGQLFGPPMTISEAAQWFDTTRQTMAKVLREMEAEGDAIRFAGLWQIRLYRLSFKWHRDNQFPLRDRRSE